MFDEPASSLDNKVSDIIFENIRSHPEWNKKTFIVATKKVGALKYFDRVVFLVNGLIYFQGTFDQLKKVGEFKEFLKLSNHQREKESTVESERERDAKGVEEERHSKIQKVCFEPITQNRLRLKKKRSQERCQKIKTHQKIQKEIKVKH